MRIPLILGAGYSDDYQQYSVNNDRQDIGQQFVTFQGQLTEFGGEVGDLGSEVGNELQVIVRQQSDLISPVIQNPEVFVPIIFGSVLLVSSLAIAIQNFFYPRYEIPEDPGW